jgi:hypothetical protein
MSHHHDDPAAAPCVLREAGSPGDRRVAAGARTAVADARPQGRP